ncbi:MAG: hypothetical protein HY038_12865 [Nitrospirae bacterium]|nr:hypothetical protein [Nitrospirota bacterium]
MRFNPLRPIRSSGWAFPSRVLNPQLVSFAKSWLSVLSMLVLAAFPWLSEAQRQSHVNDHHASHETAAVYALPDAHPAARWEGSAQGIAYSEFNHRFVGLLVVLFGLSELGHALSMPLPLWTRLVLPGALGVVGVFLLVWSDHEAWPIGPLSFVQTFFGHDREMSNISSTESLPRPPH